MSAERSGHQSAARSLPADGSRLLYGLYSIPDLTRRRAKEIVQSLDSWSQAGAVGADDCFSKLLAASRRQACVEPPFWIFLNHELNLVASPLCLQGLKLSARSFRIGRVDYELAHSTGGDYYGEEMPSVALNRSTIGPRTTRVPSASGSLDPGSVFHGCLATTLNSLLNFTPHRHTQLALADAVTLSRTNFCRINTHGHLGV